MFFVRKDIADKKNTVQKLPPPKSVFDGEMSKPLSLKNENIRQVFSKNVYCLPNGV